MLMVLMADPLGNIPITISCMKNVPNKRRTFVLFRECMIAMGMLLLAMFFGIVFGGMYGIYLLAAKKAGKKDHFAFGPFLCAGIVIAMLFGGPVLEWYCAFL